MIEWPTTIPLPYVDYSGGPRNATITSGIEQSYIQRRNRFARSYVSLQVSWVLNISQHDAFAAFFANTVYEGVAQFSIELKYPRNTTLELWIVRFLGGYEAEYLDGMWAVSAGLDLVRRSTLAAIAPVVGWEDFLVVSEDTGADPEEFLVGGEPFKVRIP